MEIIALVVLAVVPPILFLLYILRFDKLEPEPLSLIVRATLLGGLVVIPAGITELALQTLPLFSTGGIAGAAIKSFLLIAPIEEAVKLAAVMLFFWKHKEFNEENDGIVYTGCIAIGFALVENVFYVIESGLAIGLLRAVTSIPLHTFTGVLMGYYVGLAKFAPSPVASKRLILRGFLIAYLVHGAYDTVVLSETAAALLMVPIVVALFIVGIRFLKKGTLLSAQRWSGAPGAPGAASTPEPSPFRAAVTGDTPPPGSDGYKILISRVLFALCAVFWALLIIGMVTAVPEDEVVNADAIAGGIVITIVPIVAGIVLELSHARNRKTAAT